ncbi:MAG: hypothetical protein K6G40_07920 [Eubacterium sp.]|nr:hypothetical protein [Eubacterium sp.]
MNKKILYLGQKSTLSDNYYKIIKNKYDSERPAISSKGLYKEINGVECIVIYSTGLEADDLDVINTFITIFPTTYLPVVVIGDKISNNNVKKTLTYPVELTLDIQSQSINLIKELEYLLIKNAPKKPEKATLYVFDTISQSISDVEDLLSSDFNIIKLRSLGDATRTIESSIPPNLLIAYHSLNDATKELFEAYDIGNKNSGSNVIIYGPQISSYDFEKIRYLSPSLYILENANAADFINNIKEHLM